MGEGEERTPGRASVLRVLFRTVAFALTAIYRPRLFVFWWPLDYFLTALVIAWLSAFQWVAMCWLMERAGR